MIAKCLEVRDSCTFLPVLAISTRASNPEQLYLLRRTGYGADSDLIILCRLHANHEIASYSSLHWPPEPRTIPVAHKYIEEHWKDLKDGDVVDVELILGETTEKKVSEKYDTGVF